jgi:hypothetical protein
MSADIITGIDNLSLLLLCALIALELYGFIIGNDILLIVGFVAVVVLYIVRIRNRQVSST